MDNDKHTALILETASGYTDIVKALINVGVALDFKDGTGDTALIDAANREYIDIVPPVDNPEVFGLHPNADLTFRLKESLEMINTLTETRPKDTGGGGGVSKDEMV